MLYEGISTEAKIHRFVQEMALIVGNYTHLDWYIDHIYGVGSIFVITVTNMFHNEQKRFRISCKKFDQIMDEILKDQIIKRIEYILDNTISSESDYEINRVMWNDIRNCWVVEYGIRWFDKNSLGYLSRRMLQITEERIYEIYN